MKIIRCTHVTATERKHLKAFLASGHTQAKVNTKTYTILSGMPKGNTWEYEVRITTPTRNDHGERTFDNQTITVQKPLK